MNRSEEKVYHLLLERQKLLWIRKEHEIQDQLLLGIMMKVYLVISYHHLPVVVTSALSLLHLPLADNKPLQTAKIYYDRILSNAKEIYSINKQAFWSYTPRNEV